MRLSHLLTASLLQVVLGSARAWADPCIATTRVAFTSDLGEPAVTGIFTELEGVSKRNHEYREKVRIHKCALIKLTGTKTWKAASKKLPEAAANSPEVLAEVKKLFKAIPPKAKYAALLSEAKAAEAKLDAMVEVSVPESKSAAYLKNIEDLRGFVTDVGKTAKHMGGMKKRMRGIIQKNVR